MDRFFPLHQSRMGNIDEGLKNIFLINPFKRLYLLTDENEKKNHFHSINLIFHTCSRNVFNNSNLEYLKLFKYKYFLKVKIAALYFI